MKHTEENIVRPNTSKKHADADLDNVKDLLTGIMLTLETKELTEGATDITENTVSNHVAAEGSGGDLSLFSTPKHPGMNEDIFSPFSELFGLRKDDSDAQSQPTADLHDSRRKPGPSSRDDAECEAEFFHSPNSSTVRCVTVSNGSNDNSSDGEKEPKDPFCNNPLLQLDENFLDKEDQQSQQLSMPSKWRKSEEQPAENSGKYSEGRGKEDKRRRSAPRGPLGDAQSQSSLHTLRSQTKRPDMCFLGSGGHGLLPKLKRGGSPIEIRTGESVDLAENKGIPKGKKNSGGNQLRNPKKASNSEQMLKETEDEPCFKGLSEMKVSTTYISPRPSNSSTDSTKNSSTFLPKLTPQDDDETPNKSLDEDEVDERPHCVSPDISDFDISDFDSSSDSSTDKLDNVTENNESCAKRRRVSFGALLRPELFDENLPPNTPLKKGESPETRKTSSGTYVPRKSIMKQTHSKPPEKEPSDSLVEGILHTKDPSQELPATFSIKKKSARGRDNNSLSKLLDERATSIPEIQTIQPHKIVSTPSLPRRSSSGRRSQFDTLQTIYAKRRSGASKANIMVVHSWADVVRLGTKKPQAHVVIKHGLERRIIKKQKRLTPKVKEKPANHAQNHFSTGHANSPCTIVIGRAHTEKVTVPIRPCRMLNNFVLNPKMDMNEDLTGLADMFETPIKQKTANASPEIGTTLHKSSSGDEDSLEQRSDNYFSAERLIPTISNTTEQLYGQSITCRRSPRNRQRRVDNDEIVKTLKEISEIRSDEITKTPLQEVDVDPKILTPSSKKVKTCTSKENVSTPYLGRIKTPPLDQKVISMEEKFESGNVNRATPKISRKFVEPSRTSMAEHHPVITSATATHITSNSRANTFNIKGATEVAYKVEKEKENAIDIDLRNQKPKLSGQLVTTSLKRKSNKEPPVTDQPTRIIKQSRSQNEEYSPTGANKISIKPGIVSLDFQAAPGTVTPNYINEPGGMKKVIRTPKGKRKTEDLIVIRVPMATPTSMVAELKEDEENKVAESAVDDANSVQENLGTAPKQGEVQKKLMRTVEQQTEAEDLPKQLMKTPKRKCGSVEHLTTVVKRLMGTPKDKVESEEEEVGGNERMMMSSSKEKSNQNMNVKQPLQQKGPSKDLVGLRDQLVHIQKKNVQLPETIHASRSLTTTPKQMLEPIKDRNINKSLLIKLDQKHGSVEDLTMTRRLIRTPKEKEEHLIEDVEVVKKSVETSKQKCNPEYSVSIKKFNEIPKIEPIENTAGGLGKLRRKPKGVEKLTGLRNMTVPKEKSKVVENLTGFRRLSKMSKVKPAEDQTGIKLVERTPKEKESGDDLTGMRQFMRSKKVREESLEDLTDIKMKMSRKAEVEDLIGIKKLMRTPKVKGESSEEPTGVKGLTRVSPKKVKGESPQELLGIKRSMSPKKIKAELTEDLTVTKRLRTHKKIKGESEDLTDVTVFMETPKKVVDISNPQKLQEIEILRRPAIKKFNDQENKITENILESPQEVQIQTVGGISKLLEPSREKEFKRDMFESKNLEAEPKSQEPDFEINNTGLENMDESPQESKDQSVDQCQKKICTNPYEEDENKSNISKIDGLYSVNLEDNIMMERDELLTEARSMTTEKEEDEINDFLLNNESQISISLRSKSKNKDTESLHEKSVKRSLSPSEKVEVEEPLKSGSRMFWDTVNNTENRVHLRPRKRNQAADKRKRSSSDLSDIENAEQKSVKNLTETFDNAVPDAGTGIMLRSSNKNKDPPSESDVSQTVDEKKPW
ncbi:LOW QUALITY PROTEIN: proliferation marker protein Ki-67 [Phascolarctos cinereus]|uniref:LOW QUALITY PROTEIN: proliferation marker protein Ki-67-like n=1 Tax=Phascolarctos cinereus TaxID=38626 RepID=A0A6P5JI27_PHACI|nr:LOW QUALITY PROTEIN: proliferation marker protein Ki-67-like [Phascolarctos cinereus]